ncbi:hypothetical protein M758_4G134700 [Ceratodon purpureus]|nr:hypothetical protein M758_4G134700 [Ceratodon purpureus]
MATTSLGVVSSGAVQVGVQARASSSFRNRGAQRGFLLAPGRSFRAFRMIKKSSPRALSAKSPRLSRSFSRFVRVTASGLVDPRVSVNSMSGREQEDDVMKNLTSSGDDASVDGAVAEESDRIVDTVNAVLADIVDGQKYIKETGRTKPRPMKRRAMVVCLALGAFRGPLDDVEGRLGTSSLRRSASTSRLSRVPSSGFARTAHLISQLSFGSPKSPAGSRVAAPMES